MTTAALRARRIRQTMRFRNAPRVLLDLASSRTPWRREQLEFRLPDGGVITGPNFPGARVPVYEVFVEDAYGLDQLTAGLRPDFVALDIGGHIGSFSIALARHSPGCTIHAYEASPVTAGWLAGNVRANDLADRVHARHGAVSSSTGTLSFADNGRGSGLNGLTAPAGSEATTVPCVGFDDAVAEAGGRVEVVKIDTEGAEYDIVLASSPDSWAGVQRVVLEHHPVEGHHVSELVSFLAGAGLHVVRRVGGDRIGALWLSRRPAGEES